MAYTLPPLPYAYNALEPHIDARTMEIHHTKHHQTYVNNANTLLKDQPALLALDVNTLIADLSKVPEAIRGGVRNNAGGHSNHTFFWTIIGPGKGGSPKGKLADAINATFGGFDKFKEEFEAKGTKQSPPPIPPEYTPGELIDEQNGEIETSPLAHNPGWERAGAKSVI